MERKILHVGCANRYYPGYINVDKMLGWKEKTYKLDAQMDLGQPWAYDTESIDGIVGMHVFQQLHWRELYPCFMEAYRVLKPGGALRMGLPMAEILDKPAMWLLGWNNVTLLSQDLLRNVLVDRIGFKTLTKHEFGEGSMPELFALDNRPHRGTHYYEAIK